MYKSDRALEAKFKGLWSICIRIRSTLKVQHSRVALIEASDVQIHSVHSKNRPQVTTLTDNWTLWLSSCIWSRVEGITVGHREHPSSFPPLCQPCVRQWLHPKEEPTMPTFRNMWHFQLNIFHFSVKAQSLLNYQQVTVVFHSVVLIAEPQTQTKHVISLNHRQFPTSTVMCDGKTSTEVVHILNVLPIPKSYVGDDHLH